MHNMCVNNMRAYFWILPIGTAVNTKQWNGHQVWMQTAQIISCNQDEATMYMYSLEITLGFLITANIQCNSSIYSKSLINNYWHSQFMPVIHAQSAAPGHGKCSTTAVKIGNTSLYSHQWNKAFQLDSKPRANHWPMRTTTHTYPRSTDGCNSL